MLQRNICGGWDEPWKPRWNFNAAKPRIIVQSNRLSRINFRCPSMRVRKQIVSLLSRSASSTCCSLEGWICKFSLDLWIHKKLETFKLSLKKIILKTTQKLLPNNPELWRHFRTLKNLNGKEMRKGRRECIPMVRHIINRNSCGFIVIYWVSGA